MSGKPRTARTATPLTTPALALTLLLAAGACGPGEGAGGGETTQRPRVENQELGLALAHLPAGFEVVENVGDTLVLGRTGEDPARLTVELGPLQQAGVNLVERVWEEKRRIEGLPEGVYRGQNEIGGVALGTTYTSRGRFVNDDGQRVEEYRALLVHPTQNRVLVVDYEYPVPPPGDQEAQSSRLEQLMLVLEQLEPAGAPAEAEPPAADVVPEPAPPAEP